MPSIFANLILDVQDLDRSIAFYSGLLSLPLMRQDAWEGHRLAYLSTGKTEILLLQQPKSEQNPALERGGLVIKFEVHDLPIVAKRLQAKHITVLRDLEMAPFGERTFLVADPDGYAVLLSEPSDGTVH